MQKLNFLDNLQLFQFFNLVFEANLINLGIALSI